MIWRHEVVEVFGNAGKLRDFLRNVEMDGWECCGVVLNERSPGAGTSWSVVLKMQRLAVLPAGYPPKDSGDHKEYWKGKGGVEVLSPK